MKRRTSADINMIEGPLFKNIWIFAIPLMLTGLLQLFYTSADLIIVGRFAGNDAMGSVGACSSLIHVIINASVGISLGVGVAVAHDLGSANHDRLGRVFHTALVFSALLGLAVGLLGILLARPLLATMGTPENLLDGAVGYMISYFAGVPAMMVYNYAASALRSSGDTKRPLLFLLISGLVNLVLDLMFVIVFEMGAVGVGIATAISQYVAMIMILVHMLRIDGPLKIIISHLKIHGGELARILRLGVPSAVQSALFSFANVIIQSSINSFGDIAVAANTAATSVENLIYLCVSAIGQSVMIFTGQNMGAGKVDRIGKVAKNGVVINLIVSLVTCSLVVFFAEWWIGLFSDDAPEVMAMVKSMGAVRLYVTGSFYFMYAMLEIFSGTLRGIGCQLQSMMINLVGTCGLRLIWVFAMTNLGFINPADPDSAFLLYLVWPVTWFASMAATVVYALIKMNKLKKGTVHAKI